MSTITHSISKYTVQILNNKVGNRPATRIIVRLYDDDDRDCGSAVFQDYGGKAPPKPTGDPGKGNATVFMDLMHYQAFIDVLRHERQLYWKIAWIQTGATREVSDISLDTKKEIIGDYFPKR